MEVRGQKLETDPNGPSPTSATGKASSTRNGLEKWVRNRNGAKGKQQEDLQIHPTTLHRQAAVPCLPWPKAGVFSMER